MVDGKYFQETLALSISFHRWLRQKLKELQCALCLEHTIFMFLAQIIKLLSSHCPSILGSRVHSSSSSYALAHISWNLVNRIIPGHWVCMIGWLTLYMYIFYRLHQGFAVQSTHSHSLLVCSLYSNANHTSPNRNLNLHTYTYVYPNKWKDSLESHGTNQNLICMLGYTDLFI